MLVVTFPAIVQGSTINAGMALAALMKEGGAQGRLREGGHGEAAGEARNRTGGSMSMILWHCFRSFQD